CGLVQERRDHLHTLVWMPRSHENSFLLREGIDRVALRPHLPLDLLGGNHLGLDCNLAGELEFLRKPEEMNIMSIEQHFRTGPVTDGFHMIESYRGAAQEGVTEMRSLNLQPIRKRYVRI